MDIYNICGGIYMCRNIERSNGNRHNESSRRVQENAQKTNTSRMQPSKPNTPNPGKNK